MFLTSQKQRTAFNTGANSEELEITIFTNRRKHNTAI
jgi:hypothetical protein